MMRRLDRFFLWSVLAADRSDRTAARAGSARRLTLKIRVEMGPARCDRFGGIKRSGRAVYDVTPSKHASGRVHAANRLGIVEALDQFAERDLRHSLYSVFTGVGMSTSSELGPTLPRGDAYTNTAECRFSLMKRAVYGAHHSISEAHLHRYLADGTSNGTRAK